MLEILICEGNVRVKYENKLKSLLLQVLQQFPQIQSQTVA